MSTTMRFLSSVLLIALAAGPSPADETTLLGAGFAGRPLAIGGDVVMETNGLVDAVRDFTVAEAPSWIGWYEHQYDAGIWRDAIYDDGLTVGIYEEVFPGLAIVDVSDPAAPALLTEITGNFYTSARLDDRVLTLSTTNVAIVYDLTDPAAPAFGSLTLLGIYDGARWFSAVGDALFLVDQTNSVRVLDAVDPLHPVDLGVVSLPVDRIDAMVAGDGHLYVLVKDGDEIALVTYDVAVPLVPVETDRRILMAGANARGRTLLAADGLLFAATADGQVRSFGLGDPAQPAPGWSLAHDAADLAVSASHLFVTSGTAVSIYPRTDHLTPPGPGVRQAILPRLRTVAGEGAMQIVQDYDRPEKVAGLDVSNPLVPQLGEWLDTGVPGALMTNEGLGLIASPDKGCRVLDLRGPGWPALGGSITVSGKLAGPAALGGDVAVVSFGLEGGPSEQRIYDLGDPYAPQFVGTVNFGTPRAIADRILITKIPFEMLFVDLADLKNPQLLGSVPFAEDAVHFAMNDGYAYVTAFVPNGPRYLRVIDIHAPGGPEVVAEIVLDLTRDMALNGTRLYFNSFGTARIYDVADPTEPTPVTEFPYPGYAGFGMAFNGDVTTYSGWLITRRDNGFDITDVPGSGALATSRLESAYPNPFNPSTTIAFTVGGARDLTVSIHDVRGRKVADLVSGVFTTGRHAVQWHGKDAQGQGVASGVYLVRLHGPGVESSQVVTLVK